MIGGQDHPWPNGTGCTGISRNALPALRWTGSTRKHKASRKGGTPHPNKNRLGQFPLSCRFMQVSGLSYYGSFNREPPHADGLSIKSA